MALKTFFFISEKNTMVQILGRIDSGDLSTREQHVRNFWIIPRKLLEKIDLQPVKPGICHRQPWNPQHIWRLISTSILALYGRFRTWAIHHPSLRHCFDRLVLKTHVIYVTTSLWSKRGIMQPHPHQGYFCPLGGWVWKNHTKTNWWRALSQNRQQGHLHQNCNHVQQKNPQVTFSCTTWAIHHPSLRHCFDRLVLKTHVIYVTTSLWSKRGIMQPHPHQGYFCPPCTTAPWCWHFAHVGFSSPSTKQKLLP